MFYRSFNKDEKSGFAVIVKVDVILTEKEKLVSVGIIRKCKCSKWLSVFRSGFTRSNHHSAKSKITAFVFFNIVFYVFQSDIARAEIFDFHFIIVQRMGRQVNTNQVFFFLEQHNLGPFIHIRNCRFLNYRTCPCIAKQALLHAVVFILNFVAVTNQLFYKTGTVVFILAGKKAGSFQSFQTVESTCHCQRFHVLFVNGLQVHILYKIVNCFEFSVFIACFNHIFSCTGTDSFNCSHPKTDVIIFIGSKLDETFIHIGSQHMDSHAGTLGH